jgi:two-component system chemotaxis response regulator CheB
VEPGYFSLSTDEPVRFSRPSIDVMFASAADAYGVDVIGIVLTGANADGADGLARIRAFGGQAWVQDPHTASASAMPSAALERAGADRVLPLPEMAAALAAVRAA